jgi:hypothetical protein
MSKGNVGHISNTRGLFSEAHGAGKGDKPRSLDKKKFDVQFEAIDWEDSGGSKRKKIIVTNGKRTTYHYPRVMRFLNELHPRPPYTKEQLERTGGYQAAKATEITYEMERAAQKAAAQQNTQMHDLMMKTFFGKAPFPACMGDTKESPTAHWLRIQYRDGRGNLLESMHRSDKLWLKDHQERDPDKLAKSLADYVSSFLWRRSGFRQVIEDMDQLRKEEMTASLALELRPTLPSKPTEVEVMKEVKVAQVIWVPVEMIPDGLCVTADPPWYDQIEKTLSRGVLLDDIKKWLIDTSLKMARREFVGGPDKNRFKDLAELINWRSQ